MRRYLSLFLKGNGGKDNPVLSVVPQGDRFTACSIPPHRKKHRSVLKLGSREFGLILLSVEHESEFFLDEKSILHHHK